jgi:hypothetical protein
VRSGDCPPAPTASRCRPVALPGRIRAGERLWAVRHPGVEPRGLFQVVDEERQLAGWRDRLDRVPFGVDPAGDSVRYLRTHLNRGLFTLRVATILCSCVAILAESAAIGNHPTAGFRAMAS